MKGNNICETIEFCCSGSVLGSISAPQFSVPGLPCSIQIAVLPFSRESYFDSNIYITNHNTHKQLELQQCEIGEFPIEMSADDNCQQKLQSTPPFTEISAKHSRLNNVTEDTCRIWTTAHNIDITSAESFQKLYKLEQKYFSDMIAHLKNNECSIALCQWGFEDQANHLLLQNKLPAVRWVGGFYIELIAMATGARIIPRFQEITPAKLGKAGRIRELHFGTGDEKMLVIEECSNAKAVTILVRGGSTMIVEEAERSLHDALCGVSTLIRCNRIVWGGGASEIAISLAVHNFAKSINNIEQYAVRTFADALEQIPMALAENSGLNALKALTHAKGEQADQLEPYLGIDCMSTGNSNMKDQKVFETLLSKKGQLELATQVVKMILKIDDVIEPQAE